MPPPGKLPLLIVEDDANTRFLMEAAARRTGVFEPITVAIDGRAALDTLQGSESANLPRLILTDLCMPHMNGLELLRAVKRDPFLRTIPVAIITSTEVAKDRDAALADGALSFLSKPYGVEALINTLMGLREACDETAGAAARHGTG